MCALTEFWIDKVGENGQTGQFQHTIRILGAHTLNSYNAKKKSLLVSHIDIDSYEFQQHNGPNNENC